MPLPVAAKTMEYAPCEPFHRENGLSQCDFGVKPEEANRTIALIGDSHASHWRTPLNHVAEQRGWHGVSITRTSCPFSIATKIIPEPAFSECERWVQKVPEWFREHPEVDTAFVVAITGGKVNVPPGRTMFEAKVNGYRNAWKTLPDTVKHIVVIRDTPKIFADTVECIDRALAAQERVGTTCAEPRSKSLEADPQVVGRPHLGLGAAAGHRPQRALLQPQALLPGGRRRARLQGPAPLHAALGADARTAAGGEGRGARGELVSGA